MLRYVANRIVWLVLSASDASDQWVSCVDLALGPPYCRAITCDGRPGNNATTLKLYARKHKFRVAREPVTGMEVRNGCSSEAYDGSLIATDRAVKRKEQVMDPLSWQRTRSRLWKRTSRRLEGPHLCSQRVSLSNATLC